MGNVSQAVVTVCIALLRIISIAMVVRAVMSWFLLPTDKLHRFFVSITEPFIIPVRKLLSKTSLQQRLPIDLSFLLTLLVIDLLERLLVIYF